MYLIRACALNLTGSVCLLSRHHAVLERFVAMFPHNISFLDEINHPVAKLDAQFKIGLCVLAENYGHPNKLNMLLQERQKMLCNLYKALSGLTGTLYQFEMSRGEWNYSVFSGA